MTSTRIRAFAETLVNSELTLWESGIIMEYLDERFPASATDACYPVARGESRLYMHRIEKDWYTLMNTIINGSASEADAARKQLREELLAIAPVFGAEPISSAMSSAWSIAILLRCCGRLPQLGISFSGPGCERAERLYRPASSA